MPPLAYAVAVGAKGLRSLGPTYRSPSAIFEVPLPLVCLCVNPMVISCLQEYELEADARRKSLGMLQRRYVVEPTKDILAMLKPDLF